MIKAAIFDLDETLRYSWATPDKKGQIIPGVKNSLEQLRKLEIPVSICSNRAGALWNAVISIIDPLGKNIYPSVIQDAAEISSIAFSLQIEDWYISLWDERIVSAIQRQVVKIDNDDTSEEFDPQRIANRVRDELSNALCNFYKIDARVSIEPDWRKPKPGMLLAAARSLEPTECIYIGDMDGSRQDTKGQPMSSDRDAAHNAGMHFLSAKYMSIIHDVIEMFNLAEEGEDGERLSMLAEICGRAGVGIDRGKISTKEI